MAEQCKSHSHMKSETLKYKQTKYVKPFLRWAGGKSWVLNDIYQLIPNNINNYYEPFLGGGSVFFSLKQNGALNHQVVISDLNGDLMSCYQQVRDNVELVIGNLKRYENTKKFYYSLRKQIPNSQIESAARFIFLNRTSYNGIYRVNLNGVYNVPYGYKTYKLLFDFKNLRKISGLLQNTIAITEDFSHIAEKIRANDLVFLDPPYTVAHNNNGFIKYNQNLFSWNDQIRLSKLIKKIDASGAYYILTNAATPEIEKLFTPHGKKMELERYSVVGGKNARRQIIKEFVFTNAI